MEVEGPRQEERKATDTGKSHGDERPSGRLQAQADERVRPWRPLWNYERWIGVAAKAEAASNGESSGLSRTKPEHI